MPTRIAASLTLVSLLLACGGSHSPAVDPGLGFPPPAEVDRLIRSRVEAGLAEAIVVGLLEADGTRRIHAYGDAGDGIPLDGGTLFEIGSITKVFASTVLAQMVRDGILALDDPVQAYLPDGVTVPSRPGQAIRFVDLATHRSGLPTMPPNRQPGADYPAQRLYDFLSTYEPAGDVGAEARYSNVAVALMGHALALIETAGDFEVLVRRRILDPLGMASTAITLDDDQRSRLTKGHGRDGREAPPIRYGPASPLAAASALRSSAIDLLTFLEANIGEPASDLELAMRMTHETRSDFSPDRDIGLNWFVTTVGDHRIIWHGGDTLGYSAFLGFDPDRGMGVVLLTNSAAPNKDIGMHLLNRNVPLATAVR